MEPNNNDQSLILEKITDDNTWDNFSLQNNCGNFFASSSFLNSYGKKVQKFFLKEDKKILASFVYSGDKPLPYALYNSIIISENNAQNQKKIGKNFKILTTLLELVSKEKKSFYLSLHPDIIDLRPFQWHNYNLKNKKKFKLILQYTGVIELDDYTDFDQFLGTIRSVRRQEYRKAINSKLIITKSKNVKNFLNLYRKTFARQNLKIYDEKLVQSILNQLIISDSGDILFCSDHQDNLISAIVIAHDKSCSYYLFGASDPRYRNMHGNTYLILNSIEKLFYDGRKKFDLCGVNSPNRGDFKLSFNAKLIPYFSAKL